MDEPIYHEIFPETRLNTSNIRTVAGTYLRNSDIFEVVGHKGVYKCAGVGGAITGYGLDYGIIDDPIKNRDEAESPVYREKIWQWYMSTFRSRKQKDACILITMTRWHEDDLVGRLLKLAEENPKADQWEVFSLPALTDDEPLAPYDERTGPGQALWADEFSVEDLLSTKASLTVYEWLSLYQQRPSSIAGNLVKKEQFKYCSLEGPILDLGGDKRYLLSRCRVFQTCDPAASTKTSADYFVLGTWVQTPNNDLALIDLIRTRLETPDQVPLFRQQYTKWKPFNAGLKQYVESAGIGKSLYQLLVREGLPVEELKADTDKVSRFIPAATRIAAGCVYFRSDGNDEDRLGNSWLHDLEAELLGFPNGAHDDICDVVSYACGVVIDNPFYDEKIDLTKMFATRAR
jgi:predicted phage terminase large subunit-like protein